MKKGKNAYSPVNLLTCVTLHRENKLCVFCFLGNNCDANHCRSLQLIRKLTVCKHDPHVCGPSMYFCVVLCIDCFVTYSVLFVCVCVLNYCYRVATQLQLNISYHIKWKWIRKNWDNTNGNISF